jgi:aldehyde:ferredoxin oxidoreductase
MNPKGHKVLEIDLKKHTSNLKSYEDLKPYIGGVSLNLKLFELHAAKNPIIFSVGPLNGFFPYASMTAVVFKQESHLEDMYIGGSLSNRIAFSGVNALVLHGRSPETVIVNVFDDTVTFEKPPTETKELGLPGKRSVLEFFGDSLRVDKYFGTPGTGMEHNFIEKNLAGIVVTGTKNQTPKRFNEYTKLYENLLSYKDKLNVPSADRNSCANCPLGCKTSHTGELGGNILTHSLVACGGSEKVYSDIGLVFSCLNVLGYDYTHEDLENLPDLVEKTLEKIKNG